MFRPVQRPASITTEHLQRIAKFAQMSVEREVHATKNAGLDLKTVTFQSQALSSYALLVAKASQERAH